MMHITDYIFHRKAIFYFIFFAMLAGGILAFQRISKLEDPELVVMQSQIVTVYPGASAHEVEMQVTNVIEEKLNTLANVESIRSKSMANLSIVAVTLELTVPQDEIEQRWDYLRRRMNEVLPALPEGAQPPVIYDDFGDVYGMFYAMTAEGFTYSEMSRMARYIKREMLAVEGVARVEIYGEQEPVTEIVFTPSGMGELGIYPLQVMAAVNGRTSTVYPGPLQTGDQRIGLNVDGKTTHAKDVANTMVKGINGNLFKLSDIAAVNDTYSDPLRNTLYLNNQKAIGISLSMESGENIVEVGKRVEKRLAELQQNMPVGYNFEKVFFQPDMVKKSIDGFMLNLIASVAIVILVLMISMGLRSGFIIGTGLILTVLATFPILLAAGGTLQRISLGAFIIAMGMLVDNAIVVLDGILVNFKKGIPRPAALINPAKKTAWPLLGATFIAVAAFLPVYLSQDAAGTYARDLFVVLCISLLISWLLAMTQVPLFAGLMLKPSAEKGEEALFTGKSYRTLRKVLYKLLHYKTLTLTVSALLLLAAALNFGNIRKTFFPDFNYNQAYIEYRMPAGVSPRKVQDDLNQITAYLNSLDEVKMVVSSHGQTPTRYCLVRPLGEAGDNYGELIVNFDDYKTMIRMKPLISEYLHRNFPDARTRIRKYNLSIKASHTVEAEFSGPDPAVLRDLSRQAMDIFRENPYVDPYTLEEDWESPGEALTVRYNAQAAGRAGVSRQDVSNALLAATDGLPIGSYFEDQTRVNIMLKLRNNDGSRIENPGEIPVWSMLPDISGINEQTVRELMTGIKSMDDLSRELVSPVPLSAVTHGIDLTWQEPVVHRVNGRRAIQVQCDPKDGYSPAETRRFSKKAIEAIPLPAGYQMQWVGEHELQGDALRNIFRFLPISILLIILTLILLFNDFRKPLIVILCIPMAFIGIVPGMILAGQPFTFMAIIGSFGLMGMIVKNAIVLIDEAQGLIAAGIEKHLALINATISRARPVILASLTTILGMLPLLTDPMYASMAVAIISGLLVGTLITLLFVPILYAVFYGVKPASVPDKNNDTCA
ncbi:multidrug efflux pump subunit AcrB [Lentimicrobium saccharophilum]|uniref:Multidrug efflux pump subunit AcrB n=1 Tax=Lentimicrobium saccharophilum TaxID=1678841 RepID=A0A0S7C065_9BACT|nr:efflux RND transporter permease subunit [Lentimicrobium saccharophilum]GAP43329.1 multidrug efflux pump subunit AcrB [Lentimicrobium saccharophilum]